MGANRILIGTQHEIFIDPWVFFANEIRFRCQRQMLKVSDTADGPRIDLMLIKDTTIMIAEGIHLLINERIQLFILKGTNFLRS